MQNILIEKLHGYLLQNHPDLLLNLQPGAGIMAYLELRVETLENLPEILLAEGKPAYVVEEICMEALTKDLRPSKFNYLCSVLQAEFEAEYTGWRESGILTYEVINLLQVCTPVFEHFKFSEETEDDRFLSYAVIGTIREYMEAHS
jgi:uncharacterized protein DUF1896